MRKFMDIITQIRVVRAQLEIPPSRSITALVTSSDEAGLGLLKKYPGYIMRLAKAEKLDIAAGLQKPPRAVTALSGAFNIYIPVEGVVDLGKERARLEKEADKLAADLATAVDLLANCNFTSHAPKEEVEKITLRRTDTGSRLERLKGIIKDLA